MVVTPSIPGGPAALQGMSFRMRYTPRVYVVALGLVVISQATAVPAVEPPPPGRCSVPEPPA